MPELRTEALVHLYRQGGVRALDGVDLYIPAGDRVAIIGQNGSGKSTLVRHFNGLLRPTSGRVLLDGADARQMRVAALAHRVGLAFQDPDRQIFSGSVVEEVAFGPRNLGRSGAALREAVAEALEATGLTGDESRNPYDLGQSRRRLLGLASVLAMATPVLILDEPTAGLDRAGLARVRSIVASTGAAGRTVVAISHDLEFVAELFSRVVVMRAGRVVLDGSPAEVFDPRHREVLSSTNLEPPLAARVSARMGLAAAVTESQLVAGLLNRTRGTAQ